jgi:hypothetical protein
MSVAKRDRSRRHELQRMLGELGTILPRLDHGTVSRPAQGWYAQLAGGEEVFLGDYAGLAVLTIEELKEGRA